MNSDKWRGRVALVTGASSGIGAATALKFARNGMKVVGCARHPEKIEELVEHLPTDCSGSIEAVRCDVGKEEDILALFELLNTKYGGVDVCVNNAGVGHSAPLLSGSTDDWKSMLDVNVLGVAICTREAVASMTSRSVDDGHIFNICSTIGHTCMGTKQTNFYAATKFAVRAMTEGTRAELRQMKSHIRITELSPGVVETEFFPKLMGNTESKKLYKSMECLQSEDIAEAIFFALSAPPHVQIGDILMRSTEQQVQ